MENIMKGLKKKTSDAAKQVLNSKDSELGEKIGNAAGKISEKTIEYAGVVGKMATDTAVKAKTGVIKSKDKVMEQMDVNGDGKVDIEDIIILGMKTPGIRINRSDFLQSEFKKSHTDSVIEDAIENNPAHAGITRDEVDKIADEVIKYERLCVSGISALLGAPGGAAMAATIPADIIQYYGYMLRATQKLLYLYGFPEITTEENGQTFDSETLNILILCLGVMYGAAGANNAIKGIAKALSTGVEKQLLNKALTKGTIYPIVKSVSKWFGVKMTKDVFAGFFKKSIPVIGGIIGGGLTFATFKPCCDKLKHSLQDTLLSNPESKTDERESIIDVISKDITNGIEIEDDILDEILEQEDSDDAEESKK